MLKSVTTEITYKVPAWQYCNLVQRGSLTKPSKDLCRFCVKDGKGYRCALYNTPLDMIESALPKKTRDCEKAVAGFRSVVTDVVEAPPEPIVQPQVLMKATIDEYEKTRKKLLAQGYPAAVAAQAAKEFILGGA